MIKLFEKLVSEKGVRYGNFFCLGMSVLIVSLPGSMSPFKSFGLALGLMGAVYVGYKITAWRWLEMVYPLVGVSTIFFGLLAFFKT